MLSCMRLLRSKTRRMASHHHRPRSCATSALVWQRARLPSWHALQRPANLWAQGYAPYHLTASPRLQALASVLSSGGAGSPERSPSRARAAFAAVVAVAILMAAHEAEARIYRRAGYSPLGEILHISRPPV